MPSHLKVVDLPDTAQAYYAPATISTASSTLQVSGQPGTLQGTFPNSYESQIHLALLNLRKILATAGANVSDITKLTLYIVNYDPNNRIHARYIQKMFGSHRAAMTLVPVSQLAVPGWLFEIDAVVALNPMVPSVPPPARALTAINTTDVLIVGAGLSGLMAARQIVRVKKSCVVLEARDRVGGKTWSRPTTSGACIVDLGAAWINDSNQSRMAALAKEFNVEVIEQNITGNVSFQGFEGGYTPFAYGDLPKLDEPIRKHLAEIRDMVEADCQKVDTFSPQDPSLDSLTFEAYLRQNGANDIAIATAAIWTRAMLGQEPTDISSLYFLNYCKSGGGLLQMRSDGKHGGQYLRCRHGTQFFAKGLAATLPDHTIRLSTPVQAIFQLPDNGGVQVSTPHGTYRARKLILSVPTPVLKTLTFSPPLPPAKKLLTDSYTFGYYTKVMAVFSSPFWVERGYCGLAQSFAGPASVIRDTSSPADGKFVLTSFLAGEPGKAWSLLPPETRQEAVLDQIAQAFANGQRSVVDAVFEEMLLHQWSEEQYAGWGCPCTSLPPGVLSTVGKALREPVGDVHFVGTETGGEWKGYMEGAVRSGERGAGEVLEKLSLVPSAKL